MISLIGKYFDLVLGIDVNSDFSRYLLVGFIVICGTFYAQSCIKFVATFIGGKCPIKTLVLFQIKDNLLDFDAL